MAQPKIIVGLLVLTVTVLLNTRPAEAANCADATDCSNGGTCPDTSKPCDCGTTSGFKGDTCEDVCLADSECLNGGTCSATSPKTCTCGDYKGTLCADECATDTDCGTDGKCETGPPKTCTCKDTSITGPGCKSGASTVASFSLMSLFVILTGFCL